MKRKIEINKHHWIWIVLPLTPRYVKEAFVLKNSVLILINLVFSQPRKKFPIIAIGFAVVVVSKFQTN